MRNANPNRIPPTQFNTDPNTKQWIIIVISSDAGDASLPYSLVNLRKHPPHHSPAEDKKYNKVNLFTTINKKVVYT
jgi:hypothetical protein